MTVIIQEAKPVALKANGDKGLTFVTSVQGNRRGYEDAEANDSAWEDVQHQPVTRPRSVARRHTEFFQLLVFHRTYGY
jgi:hypothetical protein